MLTRALACVLAAGLAAILLLAGGQQAALAGGGPGGVSPYGSVTCDQSYSPQCAVSDARECAPAEQAADRAMSPDARHRYVVFLNAETTWERTVEAAERARASLNRLLAVWEQIQRPDLGRWQGEDDGDGLSAIDRGRRS